MALTRSGWHSFLSRYGKDLVLIALIVLAMIVSFADVVFLSNTFYYQDIQFLHYPGKVYFVQTLG